MNTCHVSRTRQQPPSMAGRCWITFAAVLTLAGCGAPNSAPPGGDGPSPTASISVIISKSGIEMVLIPAGSFQMGSRTGRDDERPVHKVWVDSFLMDRTEVTQKEFERIAREIPLPNPSHFKGEDRPAEQVKMPEAAQFCNARSILEGLQPCYDDSIECDFSKTGYRLPTEAEWEYACRAGSATDYSFGEDDRLLGDFAWFGDNSARQTHPVAKKQPNPWGLFDMHGNVAEWCHDIYARDYYRQSPEKNPRGPTDGKDYVLRGGSWKSTATMLRSAYRVAETPGFSDACLAKDAIGFRCVRKAP